MRILEKNNCDCVMKPRCLIISPPAISLKKLFINPIYHTMRTEQLDIKALLKQVYLSHTAKVKGLEEEVENLKTKLHETDKKLKSSEAECKRCVELEVAFKSCQTALYEQSKWFENIGQKFSVFDHIENKPTSNKTSDESNSTVKNGEVSSENRLASLLPEKSSSAKMNLLKNLMSLSPEEYHDSLDLNTAPFQANLAHDYSTLNSDSMVLAPDTVDILDEIKSKTEVKEACKNPEEKVVANVNNIKSKVLKNEGKSAQHQNADVVKDCPLESRPAKKRSLTGPDDSGSKSKKLLKSNTVETDCLTEIKKSDNKNIGSKEKPADNKLTRGKKSPTEGRTRNPQKVFSDSSKSPNGDSVNVNSKNKSLVELDVQICKDLPQKSFEKTKDNNDTLKNSMNQPSPSLLPINEKKEKVLPVKKIIENEDIYDFQTPITCKKAAEEDSSWTVCDKKKIKKGPSLKVKSSSKYKMSFDALPPNYKKPVLRQTKLSKSIFHPKTLKETLSDSNGSPSLLKKDGVSKNTTDIDATCIPDNYEYQIIASGSKMQRTGSKDGVIVLNDESMDDSSDSSLLIAENCDSKIKISRCIENNEVNDNFEDFLQEGPKKLVCAESMNSFDRLPKKEEPNYKYKEETVRKKGDRKQLNGFDCKECEKYYADLGLSDKEKKERLKQCSRHRSKYAPPPTPEHFWELEFPDTQECKARGYMNETQKGTLKTHRRRPL
ncbi:hypothetical protein JTE90_009408 [Oedothorax gibbosus]|uniref:DNA endonuclease activator Ctp1 C-terminal domain-containing protein n=1 Tax=Oedothorax gibbosus TaxID=931172 RepID=A0AAV6VV11_9ARAC|nr:hypothetical protein JTE90_009408 [Oedothorax gibbosus]